MTSSVISKTPYRISFFGGGTDHPKWYKKNKGKVLATTIDKYSYIIATKENLFNKQKYRIRSYIKEETNFSNEISHPVIKVVLQKLYKFDRLKFTHHGDIPSKIGIGSSSAFCVGLIQVFEKLKGKKISQKKIYEKAINLERNLLNEFGGDQDQIICTVGGFKSIRFGRNTTIYSLEKNDTFLGELEKWTQLFYLGKQRNANLIERKKFSKIDRRKKKILIKMQSLANVAEKIIKTNKKNKVIDFGKLMHKNWLLKKSIDTSVSNKYLDKKYSLALKHGSVGGKLLGAGKTGILLLITPPNLKEMIKKKLNLRN